MCELVRDAQFCGCLASLTGKIGMCLTLPKKVIEVKENSVIVENYDGGRQELKTLVDLATGDFVISQRGIIIDKMDKTGAEELLNILKKHREE